MVENTVKNGSDVVKLYSVSSDNSIDSIRMAVITVMAD
jgi:hypothetical protein